MKNWIMRNPIFEYGLQGIYIVFLHFFKKVNGNTYSN